MRRLTIIPLVFTTLSLFAAPIGEKMAREIALEFFASQGTRAYATQLEIEWAGSDLSTATHQLHTASAPTDIDEAMLYIYNRLDKRGFVVVAGDDCVQNPILAASLDNNFDSTDMPDGAKAILQGWCKQIADERASNSVQPTTQSTTSGFGKEICNYGTAVWGQSAPFNGLSPTHNGVKTPCGCVATAAGIICKYWEWPSKGEGTTPEYTYTDDSGMKHTGLPRKLGHEYDWSLMKMDYRVSYTKAEGDMVATLLYDLGCAFRMQFGVDGSGANTKFATQALTTYFGYSKGALFLHHTGRTEAEWTKMLQENLKDYGPTFFSGSSEESGHAFVLDGCTDKGYFKINYGWAGSSNGYYLLPDIKYYRGQGAAFYLKPDYDGTSQYREYLALSSTSSSNYRGIYTKETEYSVGQQFSVLFRIANEGLGSFSGSYCVAHCDEEGNIKEILWEKSRADSALPPSYVHSASLKVTINQDIELGDRLQVFYKSQGSDNEWKRVFRADEKSYDEVVLKASPAEVAKSLNVVYNRDTKILTISSEHAIQYRITDATNSEIASNKLTSFTPIEMDLSTLESGTYNCSFASGGEPYLLTLKL